MKLDIKYATWCKRIKVKEGDRMWCRSESKGSTTIINNKSSYNKMMRTVRTALQLYVQVGNDDDWNSS